MENKFCSKCRSNKSRSEFRPRSKNSKWVMCYCIECEKRETVKRYYTKNPDKKPVELTSLEGEVWKNIQGYEGLYQVSNLGRIMRVSWGNRISKILKQSKKKNGYFAIQLTKNLIDKTFSVHRLVAIAFKRNTDNLPQVNHIDGIKIHNYDSNLEWVTKSGNKIHALNLGLVNIPKGEGHHAAKLTEEQVKKIRDKYKRLIYTSTMLAKEYNVSYGTVLAIVKKQRWAHI